MNVRGVVATTTAALKNTTPVESSTFHRVLQRQHSPGEAFYSATKAALDSLTRIWAQELGARQITVNGVAPGPVATDMFSTLPEEARQQMISKTALGRVGQPDDIAAVVAFLASADGRWVTGQTIAADGGFAFN